MKIKFYAHASFRIEGQGRVVVTDPFEPEISWFQPIDEPADLVLTSSNTDRFHCDASRVQGNPTVINALDIPPAGMTVDGVTLRAFPGRERFQLTYLLHGIFVPRRNAMYAFTLEDLRLLHTGDIGRPFRDSEIAALRHNVDVMFALSGGVHNIEPAAMKQAIDAIQPRIVIPMHYFHPKGRLKILPVDAIASLFPPDHVVRVASPDLEVTPATLPPDPHLYILEPSR
jgi:L-ascorbate metabolism protein UlaG (beta-lactamase superfamily)